MTDERVAEVLARHGTVAGDGAALVAALRARGWHAVVGEGADHAGHRRVTATAWRADPSVAFGVPYRQALRATKRTEERALAALLTTAPERER